MTVPDATITLGVDSPAARFSPGNWKGDAGRSGAVFRQSWNNGAWFSFSWRAGPHDPAATILLAASATSSVLSYFLNGVLIEGVPANADIVLSGIVPDAANTVLVYLSRSAQSARWNDGGTSVRVLGLRIDAASSALAAPPRRPWALVVGDSITEGIQAQDGQDNYLCSYTHHLERALDAIGHECGVSACGFSGWLRPGDGEGDVPPYCVVSGGVHDVWASRWHLVDHGVSLLDHAGRISADGDTGTAPALILITYMTNDALCGCNRSDAQASVTQAIASLRAAAPAAMIVIAVPFGLANAAVFPDGPAYARAVRDGVAAYQAAVPGDDGVVLLDLGDSVARVVTTGSFANPGGVHPNARGHALIGAMVAAKCALLLAHSR